MFETLIPFIPAGNAINTMINKKKNKTEHFVGKSTSGQIMIITALIPLLLVIFAIRLSWICNNNSFNFVGFLGALLCSPCYIIYQFFNNGFCGYFKK